MLHEMARELLKELRNQGHAVRATGSKLLVGPAKAHDLTDEQGRQVSALKPQLMGLLHHEQLRAEFNAAVDYIAKDWPGNGEPAPSPDEETLAKEAHLDELMRATQPDYEAALAALHSWRDSWARVVREHKEARRQ